ncbi:Probable xyloglucan endotransglucosylase/hydrolase protein 30 [Ancistrocladus abbreviatus]
MDRIGSIVGISLSLLFSFFSVTITSAAAAASSATSFNVSTISFDEGYTPLFADFNIHRSEDGRSANLLLNRYAGSGFISSKYYDYGFFSAKIKLPGDYTAGVVVAFYTSNGDVFEKNHDELDIEFLGDIEGKPWRFQTNVYGNGSTGRGREERYKLWFDPTKDFHQYSILWNPKKIIFYVDRVPIREVMRNEAMGGDYPSKPMSLYATIWDASSWATSGGRYSVRYEYEPFVSEFTDFILEGCPVDPLEQLPDSLDCLEKKAALEAAEYSEITTESRQAMKWFRERYMYYSYCYDTLRYPVPPPECVLVPSEQVRFRESGRLKFEAIPRRQPKRRKGRSRRQAAKVAVRQADM